MDYDWFAACLKALGADQGVSLVVSPTPTASPRHSLSFKRARRPDLAHAEEPLLPDHLQPLFAKAVFRLYEEREEYLPVSDPTRFAH